MTSGIQAGAVTAITKLLDRTMRTGIRWLLAALLVPCAMAQTPEADRQREYYREQDQQREEQQRRAQEEYQRQQRATEDTRKRQQQLDDETTKNIEDHSKRRAQAAPGGQVSADIRAERPKLLAMPPLPAERNVLLGSWRLEGSSQQRDAQQSRIAELAITGKGSLKPGDLQGFISSMDSGQMLCDASFGRGITFTPTTYSSGGAAGIAGGPLAYRSPNKQVIVAIPGDARANPMFFEIAGPESHCLGGHLRTGAGRCACGQCRAERGDCAGQRAHVGRKLGPKVAAARQCRRRGRRGGLSLQRRQPPACEPMRGQRGRRHLQTHRVAPAGTSDGQDSAPLGHCSARQRLRGRAAFATAPIDKPVFVR